VQITTAMLADAATMSDDKLYVLGGGWNTLLVRQVPAVHPALALVLTFQLAWHEANESIPFTVDLVDEDDQPLGLQGEGALRVAPLPYNMKGDDLYQSMTQTFYGLTFDKPGNFRFRISSGDVLLATIPLHVIVSL
jgi:hypothetical protein